MSTMLHPESAPAYLVERMKDCDGCEADRRPRMFVCGYHEGWWDGYEAAVTDNDLSATAAIPESTETP